MNRETHVRFCEGLGCNSLGLLTYGRSRLRVGYRDDDEEPVNNRPPRRRIFSGTHRVMRAP
jgi:hypothetical protein